MNKIPPYLIKYQEVWNLKYQEISKTSIEIIFFGSAHIFRIQSSQMQVDKVLHQTKLILWKDALTRPSEQKFPFQKICDTLKQKLIIRLR